MIADTIGYLVLGFVICLVLQMLYYRGHDQREDLYDRLLTALGPNNIRRYDSWSQWAIAVRRKGDRVRLVRPYYCELRGKFTGDLLSQDLDWAHIDKKHTLDEFVAMVKEELGDK